MSEDGAASPRRGHRVLAHTADAGFEAWGPSLGDAYAESAAALCALMGEPRTLAPSPAFRVEASGVDRADLLVRLLAEVLARFELEALFVTGASCDRVAAGAGGELHAALTCRGGRVDPDRETGLAAIKAVTYHGLSVRDEPHGVRVRVFVDV